MYGIKPAMCFFIRRQDFIIKSNVAHLNFYVNVTVFTKIHLDFMIHKNIMVEHPTITFGFSIEIFRKLFLQYT